MADPAGNTTNILKMLAAGIADLKFISGYMKDKKNINNISDLSALDHELAKIDALFKSDVEMLSAIPEVFKAEDIALNKAVSEQTTTALKQQVSQSLATFTTETSKILATIDSIIAKSEKVYLTAYKALAANIKEGKSGIVKEVSDKTGPKVSMVNIKIGLNDLDKARLQHETEVKQAVQAANQAIKAALPNLSPSARQDIENSMKYEA